MSQLIKGEVDVHVQSCIYNVYEYQCLSSVVGTTPFSLIASMSAIWGL